MNTVLQWRGRGGVGLSKTVRPKQKNPKPLMKCKQNRSKPLMHYNKTVNPLLKPAGEGEGAAEEGDGGVAVRPVAWTLELAAVGGWGLGVGGWGLALVV